MCVQNANDGNAVVLDAKVEHMAASGRAPVARADVCTILRLQRCLRQLVARVGNNLRVTHGLLNAPLPHGVVKDVFQVGLRSRTESVFGHDRITPCAACACAP